MYKQYIKRFVLCILGLALYGAGCVLGVKAGDAGTNAWSTLALGFGSIAGLSYGTATFLISLVIITIDILGKGKLGFGYKKPEINANSFIDGWFRTGDAGKLVDGKHLYMTDRLKVN